MSDTKKKKTAPLPKDMIGTSEAAKKIGCTARELRVWLRSKNGSNGGKRYAWDEMRRV